MDSVTHFEIPCDDTARAQKFYQDVFGWQFAKLPDMDYHMITTTETDPQTMMPKQSGAINGGMRQRQQTGEAPIIVLNVPSLDDRLKKVEEAGGKVVLPKMDIGAYGFYACASDTEGNVIGIWQSAVPASE